VSKKLKNIGIVSLLTIVSRVLGLMRDQLGAAIFGASVLNSAFLTAFRLPNLFRRLLGEGSLTAAFLPTLELELHENGREGAFRLLNKVVSWLALITTVLVVVAMMVFGHARAVLGWSNDWAGGATLVRFFFGDSAGTDKWLLVADLTVILFPYLALVCVAAAFNATLNVFEHFTEPALSPIWLNLAMIVSLGGAGLRFADSPLGEIHWLCAGVLFGGFLQMAVPAGVLMRMGWRPRPDFGLSARTREIARLMVPGFFGTAIYQVNIFVGSLLAYSLNDSAGTLMFYSNRLMELPIGVFAIAISTVVYPLIARHAAEGRFDALAEDFHKGLRLILLINLPAAVGLALLSGPVVRLLFRHGEFGPDDARAMAPLVTLFAVGMPFFSVVNMTVRAFYALKDTSTPVKIAAIDFVVNLGLSLILMRWLGTAGLVLASTTAIIVQTVLLDRALTRKLPAMNFATLLPTVGKVLLAATAMGVAVWAGERLLLRTSLPARAADLLAVVILIPIGVAIYALALPILRVEGREEFYGLLLRFVRRGRKSGE
jgi:putative peptidoglycan lipid II flippase